MKAPRRYVAFGETLSIEETIKKDNKSIEQKDYWHILIIIISINLIFWLKIYCNIFEWSVIFFGDI